MTCREKLKAEHPEFIGNAWFGRCKGCPHHYGYLPDNKNCKGATPEHCQTCWDQECSEANSRVDIPWEQFKTLIDDAMEKRDRTVSIYIHPENGLSVNVYPWPDAEELYNLYKDGKITANDFRTKMGLSPLNEETWDMLRKNIVIPKED